MVEKFPLEIAFRHAFCNPKRYLSYNLRQEFPPNDNWFFNSHSNKLAAEISLFNFQENVDKQNEELRYCILRDVSM